MSDQIQNQQTLTPGRLFYLGLGIVLLANWLPFLPAWYTFVHMWRVEIAASIFLSGIFVYVLVNLNKLTIDLDISRDEIRFVILPILAFILWSLLSTIWAPFWKSALHHTFIWIEYLAFYLLFRYADSRLQLGNKILVFFVAILAFYALPAVVEYCAYLSFGGTTTLGMRFAKYGEQVVTILPLFLLVLVRLRGRQFVAGAIAASLLWLLIFCTFGRINYILFGSVLLSIFAALLISKRHRQYLPRFALVLLLFALAPLPLQIFSLGSTSDSVSPLDRFSDSELLTDSNNFRKLMMSVSGEMIRRHSITGIGADNFGFKVNEYRALYGQAHPDDVNLAAAEDQNPEHAHNEFLQIVAELGAVGAVIIVWLLSGIALMTFRAMSRIRSGAITGFAAVAGIGAFLISSLVSAYSFRVMQNGIFFFFVLAIAVRATMGQRQEKPASEPFIFTPFRVRTAIAIGLLACLGLTIYSGLRVTSVMIAESAARTRTMQAAMPLYEFSMRLDDENPDVRQNLGARLFRNKRYAEAIPFLESATAIGRATSADLSYIAIAYSFDGHAAGAERALATAAALYPRSPFVLSKYGSVLAQDGKEREANEMFERAARINSRDARAWQALIGSGPKVLSDLAARDAAAYSTVMELKPQSSIYPVVAERLILHPDEQIFSFGKLTTEDE